MKNSFVRLVTLILLLHAGCGSRPTPTSNSKPTVAAATEPAANKDHRRQFGSFSLAVPDGWYSVDSGRKKTKVALLSGSRFSAFSNGIFMVDEGKPALPTAQMLAEAAAVEFKGTVENDSIELDGEPAVLITTKNESMTSPRRLLITIRGGKAYILSVCGKNGSNADNAFSQVCNSWKWSE